MFASFVPCTIFIVNVNREVYCLAYSIESNFRGEEIIYADNCSYLPYEIVTFIF